MVLLVPCHFTSLHFHLLDFKVKITPLFPNGSCDCHSAKNLRLGLCASPGFLTFYPCVFKKLSLNILTFKTKTIIMVTS